MVEAIHRRNIFVDDGFMYVFDAYNADGKNVFGRVELQVKGCSRSFRLVRG